MLTTPRYSSKPSPFILYALAFIFSFLLCLPWVSAKETPKLKPQDWQINGIVAALDDSYDEVKGYAFDKLAAYELKDLKTVVKKPEDIAQKIANILKDEKVDFKVRRSAAYVLSNFKQAAARYMPDILNFLKDKKVDLDVRRNAAYALRDFGQAAARYIPDILKFLKDEKVDCRVRRSKAFRIRYISQSS
ncbi:HEAT repeat domain-containing protein, partial [Nostoc sp. DedQUE02]|uniref:HEAT repeat domain-containing protein n=1 Tax=Nostoc sp. DedQUE02 TaxID=3075388 RepID=UPI00391D58C9